MSTLERLDLTHPTSVVIPDDLTFNEWADAGATLVEIDKRIMWLLGDWWLWGERRYGEAASAAAPTGYSAETCRKAAWVAERITPVRRRTNVSWSHHDAVAALDPGDQEAILDRVEAEQLNVHATRALARRARQRAGEDPALEGLERCCPCCGRLMEDPT